MRRNTLTLHRAIAAVLACGGVACGLDLGGLEAVPSSGSVSTSLGDATVVSTGTTEASDDASTTTHFGDDASATSPPTVTDDAANGQPPVVDANLPDVIEADGAKGDGGDPCDLDRDGFRAMSAECGGTDCCDFDGRAFPGEQSFFTTADACGSFDYDCNGVDDPEFVKVNCVLAVLACNGSGFDQAPPACGASATFDTCHVGIGCFTSQDQEAQGCR